jgi:hypothetical protein
MTDDLLLSVLGARDSPEVICADKFLGDGALEVLIDRIKCSSSPTNRLLLRGNCLSAASGSTIAKLLKSDQHIEFLSLEWNQLGFGTFVS